MRVPPLDAVTSSRETPRATKGDVDIHGEIVDCLTERLRAATGVCVGLNREEHVAAVRAELGRVNGLRVRS